VRRLLVGRSDVEIGRRRVLSRAVRFPIRARFAEVELADGIRGVIHAPSAPYLYWAGPSAIEPDLASAFLAAARAARTVVDVGANFGFYSLLAAKVNPAARVVAIEPNPQTAAILAETIARNAAQIELHELALSDRAGVAELSLAGGLSSLDQARWPPATPTARVETRRFDDVVAGPVDVVKIDAEGAEGAILEGMQRTLERDRPSVFCEVSAESRRAVLTAVERVGYRARVLPGRAELEPEVPAAIVVTAVLEPEERDG
jgi:FkbM family methyltransferase